jgi:hypothetical protein
MCVSHTQEQALQLGEEQRKRVSYIGQRTKAWQPPKDRDIAQEKKEIGLVALLEIDHYVQA